MVSYLFDFVCIKVFEVADHESGINFILPDIPVPIPNNGRTFIWSQRNAWNDSVKGYRSHNHKSDIYFNLPDIPESPLTMVGFINALLGLFFKYTKAITIAYHVYATDFFALDNYKIDNTCLR